MAQKKAKAKIVAKKAEAPVLKAKQAADTAEATAPSFFPALPSNDFFKETPIMKNTQQFDKLTQDATAMVQDQTDAIMRSATILQKGVEEIIKTASEIAQEAGEQQAAATKTLFSCKTLNEFAEAQSKLAQSSYDKFLSNATKLSEMSVKVCTDCFAPINDQVGKAMKKASSTKAA